MNPFGKVSCILRACDNWGTFTPKAIDAFLKQDYPNKELIIIDQNPEGEKYLTNMDLAYYPDIIYLYQKKPDQETRQEMLVRIGEYRKIAGSMAHGKYLISWDDDDIHFSDRISKSVESIESGDFDCSFILDYLVKYDGEYYLFDSCSTSYRPEFNMIYKRDVFEKLHDKPEWWNMQHVIKGLNVGAILDSTIFIFRIHEGNSKTKKHIINKIKGMKPINGVLREIVRNKLGAYYVN